MTVGEGDNVHRQEGRERGAERGIRKGEGETTPWLHMHMKKAYTWFTQSGVKNPHLTSTVTGGEMVRLLSVFKAAGSSPNRVLWPSGTGAPMGRALVAKG